jgi:Glycosyl hydrolase family 12
MGRRVRRSNLKPKLAAVAAIVLAIGVGAYFGTTLLKSQAPKPEAARYFATQVGEALKATAEPSVKPGRLLHSKRRHSKPKSKTRQRHSRPASPTSSAPSSPPAPAPVSTAPVSTPVTSVRAGNVTCNYGPDTWSGDASNVGYSVKETRASNGKLASFGVVLNANKGTTEVVGYPSDQCLIYKALPSALTSSFDVTPPANSGGLDYEYAYDIWLTTAAAATSNNWNNDLELMIWTYTNGQVPAGSVAGRLSDGSKVWVAGNNTTGTVSVVLKSETSGTINIASLISQLKAKGYVTSADTGILDVEYGIEAPYGGGQTFGVNGFSVTAKS